MSKVILVVLDGLNCKSTSINMGYLNALCKENLGKFYSLECEFLVCLVLYTSAY